MSSDGDNRYACYSHVLPKLKKLVEVGDDLCIYAERVHMDRLGLQPTSKRLAAADSIFFNLVGFCRTFKNAKNTEEQTLSLINMIEKWKTIVDMKLWRTFCGRTHAIPKEKIQAFATEIDVLDEMIKQIKNNV